MPFAELARLLIENVDLWELVLLGLLIWIWRNPKLINRVASFKVGDLEVELRDLKQEVSEQKSEIERLEQEIAIFEAPVPGFDPHAPVGELSEARAAMNARAMQLNDFSEVRKALAHRPPDPTALFNASIILRKRRPTALFSELVSLLDDLAGHQSLKEIRLNTVWKLTSAAHYILIAAVRDGIEPPISLSELRRARDVLNRLMMNPRVQSDDPLSGVATPAKSALKWIETGLKGGGADAD
ncbi:MAG: hypothetical protein AAFN79_18780 [Pseudomonadota bacterium]